VYSSTRNIHTLLGKESVIMIYSINGHQLGLAHIIVRTGPIAVVNQVTASDVHPCGSDNCVIQPLEWIHCDVNRLP
jgi:hypothetical protein